MNLEHTVVGFKKLGTLLVFGLLTACATDKVENQQVGTNTDPLVDAEVAPLEEAEAQGNEGFETIAARFRAEKLLEEQSQEGQVAVEAQQAMEQNQEQERIAVVVDKVEQDAEAELKLRDSVLQEQVTQSLADKERTEIARLKGQIEVNDAQTGRLNDESSILAAAIIVAGDLTVALNAEVQKYNQLDQTSGYTVQGLDKQRLEEIVLELEALRAQTRHINQFQN